MIQVRCLICLEKEQDRIEKLAAQESWPNEKLAEKLTKAEEMAGYDIMSKVISKDERENFQLLGQELLAHMANAHMPDMKRIAEIGMAANGFQVMKYFETKEPDSLFETEKEKIRNMILEETMKCAPELEEDELDELEDDELDDDDCDDDEDEDDEEDEEFEDEDGDIVEPDEDMPEDDEEEE